MIWILYYTVISVLHVKGMVKLRVFTTEVTKSAKTALLLLFLFKGEFITVLKIFDAEVLQQYVESATFAIIKPLAE